MSSVSPSGAASTVSRGELIGALRGGDVVLVDVLPAESYAAAHIPGAINLPLADLPRLAFDSIPDRGKAIVVYCGGPT
jgi:rhodanese-related sulfurtransferase